MIVNPKKPPADDFKGLETLMRRQAIKIDGNKIETSNSADLLGIHIDSKLTFDDHYSPFAANSSCN